jgi:hypothetical protein
MMIRTRILLYLPLTYLIYLSYSYSEKQEKKKKNEKAQKSKEGAEHAHDHDHDHDHDHVSNPSSPRRRLSATEEHQPKKFALQRYDEDDAQGHKPQGSTISLDRAGLDDDDHSINDKTAILRRA